MSKTLSRLAAATAMAAVMAAPQTQAAIGDALVVAGNADIVIRFEGGTASFVSVISVNGGPQVFPNDATPVGTEMSLGFFAAGTPLDIVLHVLDTGIDFRTGPGAGNPDGLPHANVVYGFNGEPGRTFIGFEDILGGGDLDYDDYMFSFAYVLPSIPEPQTYLLMLAGLGVTALIARRRQSRR